MNRSEIEKQVAALGPWFHNIWWIPNRACVEAMLRSAGFRVETHPEEEVYICKLGEVSR